MAHQIILPRQVQKDLEKIENKYKDKIKLALVVLSSNPYSGKKLEGDRAGEWSYRVWPYRIIYKINKGKLLVLIIRIGHRQGAYK